MNTGTGSGGTEGSGSGETEALSAGPGDAFDVDLDDPETPEPRSLTFDEADDGERLDRALARHLPKLSRSTVQKHIKEGRVTLAGEVPARGAKTTVHAGEEWTIVPSPPEPTSVEPEAIPLDILYEDDDLLAVNKPAGMVVHPSLGHANGTLVNALLHYVKDLPTANNLRPGIVHRLDRETSGVILVAKHDDALQALQATFRDRRIEKRYLAVLKGVPEPPHGTYETLYGRHPHHRKKFSSRVQHGKTAVTHYVVVETYPGVSLAEVVIETGRTHQIRVHFSDHGYALVGDQTYGGRRTLRDPEVKALAYAFERTALHAWQVRLRHPLRPKKKLRIEAPIPDDIGDLLDGLRAISRTRGKDPEVPWNP